MRGNRKNSLSLLPGFLYEGVWCLGGHDVKNCAVRQGTTLVAAAYFEKATDRLKVPLLRIMKDKDKYDKIRSTTITKTCVFST